VSSKDAAIEGLGEELRAFKDKAGKRMTQLKGAFEDTARRGAKDKAKLEAVIRAGKEATEIIKRQKEEVRRSEERSDSRAL